MEWMRKIPSVTIGLLLPTPVTPSALLYKTLSPEVTSATIPGRSESANASASARSSTAAPFSSIKTADPEQAASKKA